MKKINENAIKKIIEASVEEFSVHGFNGARVARIAERAEVSQALIYYYFDSKKAILNEIVEGFINEMQRVMETIFKRDEGGTGFQFEEIYRSVKFFLSNQKVLRIIVDISLQNDMPNYIAKLWDDLNYSSRNELLKNRGYKFETNEDPNSKIIGFFFIHIPSIIFGILGNEWMEDNSFDQEEVIELLTRNFLKIYQVFLSEEEDI